MNFVLLLIIGLATLLPFPVMAQGAGDTELFSLIKDVVDLIKYLVDTLILPIASGVVIMMVIYGGVQYITGKPEPAKKTIMAALTGVIIIMFSYVIVALLATI